jgi:hypothetical protein
VPAWQVAGQVLVTYKEQRTWGNYEELWEDKNKWGGLVYDTD